jgi:hemerythrin superfamily protein
MKTKPISAPAAPEDDAVEMLTADHKRIKRLFAEFERLGRTAADEHKAAVVAQICRELELHTTVEDEIFYPACRKAIGHGDLMDEALVEHQGAKVWIDQLRAAQPCDGLYDAKVTVLGEQIEHHVTEEEGRMFPVAGNSALDLVEIAAQMRARKSELSASGALDVPCDGPAQRIVNMDGAAPSDAGRRPVASRIKKPQRKKVSSKSRNTGRARAPGKRAGKRR